MEKGIKERRGEREREERVEIVGRTKQSGGAERTRGELGRQCNPALFFHLTSSADSKAFRGIEIDRECRWGGP